MKTAITRLLNRQISHATFDLRLAQGVCFATAVVLLVLSVWKMSRLELREAEVFFGLLLSFCVPLLFCIMALLLPAAMGGSQSKS